MLANAIARGRSLALLASVLLALGLILLPLASVAEASHGGADVDCPGGSGDNQVSKEEAQRILDQGQSDTHDLDRDQDGEACDDSDTASSRESQYPSGGSDTGGGATAERGASPMPLVLSGVAFVALAGGAVGMTLRRRLDR